MLMLGQASLSNVCSRLYGGGDLTELLNLRVCFVCHWDDCDYDEVCNLIAVRSLSIKLACGVASQCDIAIVPFAIPDDRTRQRATFYGRKLSGSYAKGIRRVVGIQQQEELNRLGSEFAAAK